MVPTGGSAEAGPTVAATAARLATAAAEDRASLRVTERIAFLLQGGLVLAGSRFAEPRRRDQRDPGSAAGRAEPPETVAAQVEADVRAL
ncbi:hypothetical protein GCM10009839_92720 [Catenulispora yoronensis]|uniref:Uncharacterized protein n=1 Tax=Catenulispora yoronensis TaxID=450799 RepID=A0ABN2VMK5_9ACTN